MDSKTLQINIIRARRENPCAVLNKIGTRYGVTREYVRQVLSGAGEPTRAYRQTFLCIQCGKDMGYRNKPFCSPQCRHDFTHIKIACTYCGKLGEYSAKILIYRIERSQHSTDLFFCSKVCQGKWAGKNYGFAAHPENIVKSFRLRKWDYSKIYELKDKTGWGGTRIGRALGIPAVTIDKILGKRVLDSTPVTKRG